MQLFMINITQIYSCTTRLSVLMYWLNARPFCFFRKFLQSSPTTPTAFAPNPPGPLPNHTSSHLSTSTNHPITSYPKQTATSAPFQPSEQTHPKQKSKYLKNPHKTDIYHHLILTPELYRTV